MGVMYYQTTICTEWKSLHWSWEYSLLTGGVVVEYNPESEECSQLPEFNTLHLLLASLNGQLLVYSWWYYNGNRDPSV